MLLNHHTKVNRSQVYQWQAPCTDLIRPSYYPLLPANSMTNEQPTHFPERHNLLLIQSPSWNTFSQRFRIIWRQMLFIISGNRSCRNNLMTPRDKEIHWPSIVCDPVNIPYSKVVNIFGIYVSFLHKGTTIFQMIEQSVMRNSSTLPLRLTRTIESSSHGTIVDNGIAHG